MTDPTTQQEDAQFRDWLLLFALSTVGTVLILLANPDGSWPRTITAVTLILATQAVYWTMARPSQASVREDGPRAWAYVGIALALQTVAVLLNQWASLALFALTPQMFLLLSPTPAAAAVVALNVVPIGVRLLSGRIPSDQIVQELGTAAFIITFSLFFASRIRNILRESDERQQLIDQLHERESEVAALSAARGAEHERARIARDMHDTLAQGFTSIITLGHAVQAELDSDPTQARTHIGLITETAQENLAESRRIIAAMTPAPLQGSSLPDAIDRIVAGFATETSVEADFTSTGTPTRIGPAESVVLLRVVQESLANVRKHAHASEVQVVLAYAPDSATVTVVDDGSGFEADRATGGYGLVGMRSRVAEAGGTLQFESEPGTGTTVRATLPSGGVG